MTILKPDLLMSQARRKFLKSTVLAGSGVAVSGLPSSAFANTVSGDYKALVCVYMMGGMDQNDTILPMDAAAHAQLKTLRPDMLSQYAAENDDLRSREVNNLLELEPIDQAATQGRRYGMPQELAELHQLFNDEELSIVGSVGPLIEPTTRQLIESGNVQLPSALGSHNDQSNYWQGLAPEGATEGWGGQFLDSLTNIDSRYASVSAQGYNLFATGKDTSVYSVSSNGAEAIEALVGQEAFGDTAQGRVIRERLNNYLQRNGSGAASVLQRDIQALRTDAMLANATFGLHFDGIAPFTAVFPEDTFGVQLLTVARGIQASRQLGMSRQIYYVGVNGFDTHFNQPLGLAPLQLRMSLAIKAFRDAMVEQQMWNDVTLFTAADFGRTLSENGAGTDHGWGAHHFVTGGSVRGKRIFGRLPDFDPDGADYVSGRGRLIPTVPIERYSDELGSWLGVDAGARASILPNLANFPSIPLELFKS